MSWLPRNICVVLLLRKRGIWLRQLIFLSRHGCLARCLARKGLLYRYNPLRRGDDLRQGKDGDDLRQGKDGPLTAIS